MNLWQRVNYQNILLIALVVFLFGLVLMPLGFLLYASFWSAPAGDPEGIFTFHNFLKAFGTAESWAAILNSLLLGAVVTCITVPTGFGLAWLVRRTNIPARELLNTLMVVPLFISPLLLSLAYIALANPRTGFLNLMLRAIFGFIGDGPLNIYTFGGIVFLLASHLVPYAYLNIAAVLGTIDSSYEEAAKISGASGFKVLWNVIIPIVLPAIMSAALIVFVLAAEQFTIVTLLGPNANFITMPYLIYISVTFYPADPNFAAALGVILLVITGIGIYFYRKMAGQAFKFVTITGKGSRLQIGDLGKWRYIALGGCLVYILLAIVLPYMAIVLGSFLDYITHHITWDKFTLENYARMFRGSDNILAIGNTLLLAVLAASIGVTFALLLAFIVQRFKTVKGRGILDYMCMLPISIPGLSLALGLLWTYLYLPVPIYGTIWVLLIAYITRFLAQGYRISSSSLLQIGPELEEAARVSGASRLRALANVTVPILATPLLSSWVIIFILAALEVSVTIILYSSQSLTMSVAIWNQMAMGDTVVAYAMSVILGGIGLIVIIVAQKVFGVFKYV